MNNKFSYHEYVNYQVTGCIEPDFFADLHSDFVKLTAKKSSRIKLIHSNSKSSTGNQFLSKALYSIRIEMKYRVRNLCESIPLKKNQVKSNLCDLLTGFFRGNDLQR